MMKLDSNAPDISVIRSRLRYDPAAGKFYMLKSAGRRTSPAGPLTAGAV